MTTKNEKAYVLDFGITAFLKNGNGRKSYLFCKSLDVRQVQQKVGFFKNTFVISGEIPSETVISVTDSDGEIKPFITEDGNQIFSSWKKMDIEVRDKKHKTTKTFHLSRIKDGTTTKAKIRGGFKNYLEEPHSGIFAEKLKAALS